MAIIFATLTTIPRERARAGELSYLNAEASHQQALAQLAIYHRWTVTSPSIRLITHHSHLDDVLSSWECEGDLPTVGLVLLMENADSIRTIDDVSFWHDQGLRDRWPRPASNRFTGNTLDGGPSHRAGARSLGSDGTLRDGVEIWSHMSEEACLEALAIYPGPIIAPLTCESPAYGAYAPAALLIA